MKIFLSFSLIILLTGCITPMQAMRGVGTVKQIGAEKIADRLFDRNISQVCKWATEGAVQRKWRDNPTAMKSYRKFCGHI